MFGYIRPDDPFLYKKDDVLYNAMYCGLCKAIGELCGQTARFGLTFDIAFLSVLLHNLCDKDVKIEKKHCIVHWVKNKNIAAVDEISLSLAAVNVIMCHYKMLDDYNDSGKNNVKSILFRKGYKKAKKKYPKIAHHAQEGYIALGKVEKQKCSSIDMAADPFATMTKCFAKEIMGSYSSQFAEDMFYFLGKWIYLIDAIDDFDKDKKSGNYNVFALAYPDSSSGKELISRHKEEIFPLMNNVFWNLKKNFDNIKFYFNKDLIDNVLMRGIPKKTDEVIKKYL